MGVEVGGCHVPEHRGGLVHMGSGWWAGQGACQPKHCIAGREVEELAGLQEGEQLTSPCHSRFSGTGPLLGNK